MMAAEETPSQTGKNATAADALPLEPSSPEAAPVVPTLSDADLDAAHENWVQVEKTLEMLLKAAAVVRGMRGKEVPDTP